MTSPVRSEIYENHGGNKNMNASSHSYNPASYDPVSITSYNLNVNSRDISSKQYIRRILKSDIISRIP